MKPFEKFIKQLDADKNLMSIYRKLRQCFQREGWTEEQLENPPYYPQDIMKYFQEYSNEHSKLFNEVKSFFDIDHNDFVVYLRKEMSRINDETPLNTNNKKNGNKKRNNTRD
jgi:hypothetical protein